VLTFSLTTKLIRLTFSIPGSSAFGVKIFHPANHELRPRSHSTARLGPRRARKPAGHNRAGEAAAWRLLEFFTASIRNRNTRAGYAQAVVQFFASCEKHRIHTLGQIHSVVIAAYVEQHSSAAPTVKQHLAAIRMLFDFLVIGQIVPMKPASSVRGPKNIVRRGKTSVRKGDQARMLLDSIKADSVVGLRDSQRTNGQRRRSYITVRGRGDHV
jgi:hypothetical protein